MPGPKMLHHLISGPNGFEIHIIGSVNTGSGRFWLSVNISVTSSYDRGQGKAYRRLHLSYIQHQWP